MRGVHTASMLKVLAAQVVEKGNVRNTVLRQVKALKKSLRLLEQGQEIKSDEIKEHLEKNPGKARVLRSQVDILDSGIKHLQQSISELEKYKDITVSGAS